MFLKVGKRTGIERFTERMLQPILIMKNCPCPGVKSNICSPGQDSSKKWANFQ
jgi:hypothetical protein